MPVYQDHPERRGVSRRRVIDEAKANVPVIDLADLLCGPGNMRRIGEEWTARCPLNDHEDKSPSFTVNPEKNVWFCHGCLRGGDVVELARFAWDFDKAEVAAAAAHLLMKFGYEVPQRPHRWLEKEARHARWREEAEKVRAEAVRRRVFRLLILPTVNLIEKVEECAEEIERAWRDFSAVSWKTFVYWNSAA
jgi:DNA primase